MEHLWAPWRGNYVTSSASKATLFADIGQSDKDQENFVLARGKCCYALLNLFPYNTGHLMVVPYRAISQLEDLADEELLELMTLLRTMKAAVAEAFKPQGYNIGINLGAVAGAGIVEHLHVHLVPRWKGDANFMTTTAETRVHPSDLPQVYAVLKRILSAERGSESGKSS